MGIGALNYQGVKGGLKLNDVIEEFKYAYKGQQIKAGDFVNYIEGVAGKVDYGKSENTLINSSSDTGYAISAVELDENRVFIAHSYGSSYYLYGVVVTINGVTITVGTDTQLTSTKNAGYEISAVKLEENKVFIAHSYDTNYYLNSVVCTISGTTITKGTDTQLSSTQYSGMCISIKLLPNGNVFIAHSYSTNYNLYGIIATIDGTTIKTGSDKLLNSVYGGFAISTELLPSGNVFIAYNYSSNNYRLYAMVVTINGTTVTAGTDTTLTTTVQSGYEISTQLLDNGNVFIAHTYSSSQYLYGMICSISETTITTGTDTQMHSSKSRFISTALLNNGNVFIARSDGSDYRLDAIIAMIEGTTITAGTNTDLISTVGYTGHTTSLLLLQNGTIFIAHSQSGSTPSLYAQIWGIDEANNIPTNEIVITEYEQQVTLATEPPFDGIALSSGIGGDDTGHNQQVKIAKPAKLLSSLPVGSLVKDPSSTFLGEPVVWKVADINHEGYPDNSVTLITEKIVALRCFDAKEPSNSDYERQTSGNNRYSVSNIRQWLNSDAEAGQWYSAQHSYDAPPNSSNVAYNPYDTKVGFLNGFSANFKNALLLTTLKAGLNQLDGGGSETVIDKMFLASVAELGLPSGSAPAVEGTKLSLFNDSTNIDTTVTAKCIEDNNYVSDKLAVGLTWEWWSRTGTTIVDDSEWVRLSDNSVTGAGFGIKGVRPLCNIPSSIKVSSTPDEDGCYNIIF